MYLLKIILIAFSAFSVTNGLETENFLKSNANSNYLINQISTPLENDGGPRDVVQTAIDVTIYQQTAGDLFITILNSNGEVFMVMYTDKLQTVISTESWAVGNYTIETIDSDANYQSFSINKQ